MSDFDKAVEFVLKWEGGLSENPKDPGGITKYGISQRAHPGLDIRNLSLADARSIYKRDYWDQAGCNDLPQSIALMHFDTAVNMGVGRAREFLGSSKGDLLEYALKRALYYVALRTFPTFGRGWFRRLFSVLVESIRESLLENGAVKPDGRVDLTIERGILELEEASIRIRYVEVDGAQKEVEKASLIKDKLYIRTK